MSTVDLAYNIRAGEIMLRTYDLVRTDVFSFTAAGLPWFDQQWAAQVLLAFVHGAGGWSLVAILRAGLVGAIYLFVYLSCRQADAGVRPSAWLTISSFLVGVGALSPRPQLIGMALFAVTVWTTASRHKHPARMWLVPALTIVWANTHGSFFLAPLFLSLVWFQDLHERRPAASTTAKIAVLSLAATLINPYGLGVWHYVISLSTNDVVTRFIQEWQPPTVRHFGGAVFLASAVGVAIVLVRRRKKTPWPALLTLGAFLIMGLFALRGIVWWSIVAPVIIAGLLPKAQGARQPDPPKRLNLAIAAVLVALGISFLPVFRDHNPLTQNKPLLSDAPPGVTAGLRAVLEPGDRMFAPQRWGSWFELALPRNPVAVDSRIEVIPESVWADYVTVSFGQEGWQQVLDRWDVNVVITHPEQQRYLIPRISADPGWTLQYEDTEGMIFIRS
ncbi:MAG: hypothetical protein WD276_01430 [Actinomycetota bacterium]